MATRPRKQQDPAAPASRPDGVFARLKAEAERRRPPTEPYVIDDLDPPIIIQPPSSIEQQVGLSELFTSTGEFHVRDARRILRLLCGDAFPELWSQVKGEHISFLVALIRDMGEHFGGLLQNWDAEDHPGGSEASSS